MAAIKEHFVEETNEQFQDQLLQQVIVPIPFMYFCGPFFFALCLLIHNNKLKHCKVNDGIKFRHACPGDFTTWSRTLSLCDVTLFWRTAKDSNSPYSLLHSSCDVSLENLGLINWKSRFLFRSCLHGIVIVL